MPKVVCRDCGEEFEPNYASPGFFNQCRVCSEVAGDVPRLGGNMIWHHKTGPEIEIKSMKEAKAFASKTARFGVGPLRSIVESKTPLGSDSYESSKSGSGAENRANYTSKLG